MIAKAVFSLDSPIRELQSLARLVENGGDAPRRGGPGRVGRHPSPLHAARRSARRASGRSSSIATLRKEIVEFQKKIKLKKFAVEARQRWSAHSKLRQTQAVRRVPQAPAQPQADRADRRRHPRQARRAEGTRPQVRASTRSLSACRYDEINEDGQETQGEQAAQEHQDRGQGHLVARHAGRLPQEDEGDSRREMRKDREGENITSEELDEVVDSHPSRRNAGAARQEGDDRGQRAPRDRHRQALHQPRSRVPRPDPGGEQRA